MTPKAFSTNSLVSFPHSFSFCISCLWDQFSLLSVGISRSVSYSIKPREGQHRHLIRKDEVWAGWPLPVCRRQCRGTEQAVRAIQPQTRLCQPGMVLPTPFLTPVFNLASLPLSIPHPRPSLRRTCMPRDESGGIWKELSKILH